MNTFRTYIAPVHYVNGQQALILRELAGEDELSVTGVSTANAIALIQQLTPEVNNANFEAKYLVATDRDLILAMIYEQTYGSEIQGTTDCSGCGELYDYDFRLDEIREQIEANHHPQSLRFNEHLVFVETDSMEIRLLNGEDELSIYGRDADTATQLLLDRCCPDFDEEKEVDIERIFASLLPLMQLDMESVCPECQTTQRLQFDIQHYLLTRLLQEQTHLQYEIHRIASAYRWRPDEILAVPRRIRKRYVAFIEQDMERGLV